MTPPALVTGATSHAAPHVHPLTIAVPKGRLLPEILALLKKIGLHPEASFFDPECRQLVFETNRPEVRLVLVRAFDVPSVVAYGGASLGFAGQDVLAEFEYEELFAPLDLKIGACYLALVEPEKHAEKHAEGQPKTQSHPPAHPPGPERVATKYPTLTRQFFHARYQHADIIRLHGNVEIASILGICPRIVDLVSTGRTLRANRLKVVATLMEVTTRLIIQRTAYKIDQVRLQQLIDQLETVVRPTPTQAQTRAG